MYTGTGVAFTNIRLVYTFRTAGVGIYCSQGKFNLIIRTAIWNQTTALCDHAHKHTRKYYCCGLDLELGFI
jgi:hypothetical protein